MSDGHAGFRTNIDQSERTGTQGCVERASSRQRRLSSRRVFVADSKDIAAWKAVPRIPTYVSAVNGRALRRLFWSSLLSRTQILIRRKNGYRSRSEIRRSAK